MPLHTVDLSPAPAPAVGRRLRTVGGHLFSHWPTGLAPAWGSNRRGYVISFGADADTEPLRELVEACELAGRTTACVAAGETAHQALGRATYRWEAAPALRTPSLEVARQSVAAATAAVDGVDPDLVVLQLEDGWRELSTFVDHLRETPQWDRSVVVALTDVERDLGLVARWLGVELF
jgi:CheY-like chemotaxis protein